MSRLTIAVLSVALLAPGQVASQSATEPIQHESDTGDTIENKRWGSVIGEFEKNDALDPPPHHEILFVGSSSIRRWNLQKWFPQHQAINRGFGGSQISDSLYFADRIILQYEPRVVVIYAGDNDLAGGKSPARVEGDLEELVSKIHHNLPDTLIVYIAIKPSPSRWALIEKIRDANVRIQALSQKRDKFVFIPLSASMIGDDGKPRRELFAEDGLHLSDEGYKVWTGLVSPHLD